MKHIIVKPIANPVMKKRAKFAKKLLGMSMTAGLVLLIGSAGALDCGSVPAGQAFAQAAFGLALFGGCGWRCVSWGIEAGSSSANGRTVCSLCGALNAYPQHQLKSIPVALIFHKEVCEFLKSDISFLDGCRGYPNIVPNVGNSVQLEDQRQSV